LFDVDATNMTNFKTNFSTNGEVNNTLCKYHGEENGENKRNIRPTTGNRLSIC